MAEQRFLTPKPVTPSRPGKRFTLAEANRSLPLVRRIVSDIVNRHARIASLESSLNAASAKQQPAIQAELDKAIEQLQVYVDELREVGCELKDFQMGLVDFTGKHQGHDICLCWKLGEETIQFWHETQTGFAGRQPISLLQES